MNMSSSSVKPCRSAFTARSDATLGAPWTFAASNSMRASSFGATGRASSAESAAMSGGAPGLGEYEDVGIERHARGHGIERMAAHVHAPVQVEGLRVGVIGFAGVGELLHARLDFSQSLDVRLAANDGYDELAVFPGLRVLDQFYPVRLRRSERFEILHQMGMWSNALTGLVAEYLLYSRDGRIV